MVCFRWLLPLWALATLALAEDEDYLGPAKKLKTTKIVIKKGAGHFVYEEKAAWKYWFGKY